MKALVGEPPPAGCLTGLCWAWVGGLAGLGRYSTFSLELSLLLYSWWAQVGEGMDSLKYLGKFEFPLAGTGSFLPVLGEDKGTIHS